MNIILFAITDLPEGDATSSRVKLIAKGLKEAGNSVLIILLHASVVGSIVHNRDISGTVDEVPFLYAGGSSVRPTALLPILWNTVKGVVNAIRILIREKKTGKADLVILYTPDLFRYAPIIAACKMLGVPVFVEACEIMSLSAETMSWRQRFTMFGYRVLESLIPSQATGIIAISKRIADYYLGKGMKPGRVFKLPILVDTERFSPGNGKAVPELQGKRFFLYSGSFGEKDGISFMLKAVAMLHEEYNDVILVLTGDSPGSSNRARYQGLVEDMGLQGYVYFQGFIPFDNLVWCYTHSLALLVCRTGSAFASAGFPTKLGEFLAAARPVIATTVGDLEQYLSNGVNSLLVPPESPERIYRAMKEILEEVGKAQVIGGAGRRVALNNFDYQKAGGRLDLFLRNTIYPGRNSQETVDAR